MSHHTGAVLFVLPAHMSELAQKIMHPTRVHPRKSKVPVFRAFQCEGRDTKHKVIAMAQNVGYAGSRILR
jgi:hypothetical protein